MLNQILKRDNVGPGKNKNSFQLDQWVPICDLPKRHQAEIISRSEIINVPADTLIFGYNDKDDKDYYLLSGTVELTSGSGSYIEDIKHCGAQTLQIIDHHYPRKYNARAKENCKVFITRRTFHATLNSNNSAKQSEIPELEVSEIDFESTDNWMLSMLNAGIFSNLPPESMQQIFVSMEIMNVQKGNVIIHEGATITDYFLVQHGQCTISRVSGEDKKELVTLSTGDTFGGPTLISDAPSTIEVVMLTDGTLMCMPKSSFDSLIKEPLLVACPAGQLNKLMDDNVCLLDIREDDQYKISAIRNSTNIPLYDLHAAFKDLNPEKTYIVCGESDTQAMMGAFLLAEKNYSVRYLSVSIDEYLAHNATDGFSLQLSIDQDLPQAQEVTVADPAVDSFENNITPSQNQPRTIDLINTAGGARTVADKICGSFQTMTIELEKQIRKELNDLYLRKKTELEEEINLRFKKYHMVTAHILQKKRSELEEHYKTESVV